jgi:prolyl-tRNA editing enzyme YbaK/EbsC (Cys-tRNA(Pro) deacylase)
MTQFENKLSKNAQSVQDVLEKRRLNCRVIELPSSTRTAIDAANSIGCQVDQIVKSLIFRGAKSGKPVLVLASGPNRVNEKNLEAHMGEKIAKADADFTREVTGFAIGGIPPVGHKQQIQTLIDEDLLKFEELWAAAGTPNAVFSLRSKDVQGLTGGKIVSIK